MVFSVFREKWFIFHCFQGGCVHLCHPRRHLCCELQPRPCHLEGVWSLLWDGGQYPQVDFKWKGGVFRLLLELFIILRWSQLWWDFAKCAAKLQQWEKRALFSMELKRWTSWLLTSCHMASLAFVCLFITGEGAWGRFSDMGDGGDGWPGLLLQPLRVQGGRKCCDCGEGCSEGLRICDQMNINIIVHIYERFKTLHWLEYNLPSMYR